MKKLHSIGSSIFMASVASIAGVCFAAETPLPKDLPAYGPLVPFTPPPVQELKLANGLTVWLAPMSGFPKVAFTLTIRGGYAVDPMERPGAAELLAAAVTQGTAKLSARQIAEQLQACGGDLQAQASSDSVDISSAVLADQAEPALRLLADVAENAAFSPNEVAMVKQQAAASLDANEAETRFLARRALYRALFGQHPYAVIAPTKESIENATPDDLKSEFHRRFRPDGAALIIVGDYQAEAMLKTVRSAFSDWKAPATPAIAPPPQPEMSVSKTVVYVPRPNSVQTALYLGTLAPSRKASDYQAVVVANAFFGGMFGSRLVRNIREDKGYTYSPGSRVRSLVSTGLLVTQADVRNPVTGASFNEISYEMNRLATTTPEEQEINSAKRYLIGSLAVDLQSRVELTRELAQYWQSGLSAADLARQGERIEHITGAEVQAAGKKYFPVSRMTIVAVGEEKVIKDQLAPFGLEFTKAK